MKNKLKKMLGWSEKVDFVQLVKEGAIILDVSTNREYSEGHIAGSIHLQIDQLTRKLESLKRKNKPLITCCTSGLKSDRAKDMLGVMGFRRVHNGGYWKDLERKIRPVWKFTLC